MEVATFLATHATLLSQNIFGTHFCRLTREQIFTVSLEELSNRLQKSSYLGADVKIDSLYNFWYEPEQVLDQYFNPDVLTLYRQLSSEKKTGIHNQPGRGTNILPSPPPLSLSPCSPKKSVFQKEVSYDLMSSPPRKEKENSSRGDITILMEGKLYARKTTHRAHFVKIPRAG
jgi:hypothetical protein